MDPSEFLDRIDDQVVVEAIRAAEARGRGEIRVHVTRQAVGDAQAAAIEAFERLGMARTAERNGVLILVVPRTQAFAIVGDLGVHKRCGDSFWKEVAAAMAPEFRAGRFTEGIRRGVERAGDALALAFPREAGRSDSNELPDALSRD
jgi:uncharacterized membrane protein